MLFSTRVALALFPGLLAVLLLSSETALAHGGLSSLGALRGLLYMAIGSYLLVLCVGGIILYLVTKRRRRSAGRPFFLRDSNIPSGLRGLVLLQYTLAFICAQVVIIPLFDPYLVEGFDIFFYLIFSALAIFNGNGLVRQSLNRGFRAGMVLGWYCVVGACLLFYREGWRVGFEWVALGFGISLLASLHWKYRSHFGVDKPGKYFRRIEAVARWGGLSIVFLIVAYVGGSLMVTTVFPADEEKARTLVDNVADAMVEYRDQRGHWPTDLGQLDSSVDLSYRWSKIEYDTDKNEIWLKVRIPIEEPDLAFRLSYGFQGRTEAISSIGRRLK